MRFVLPVIVVSQFLCTSLWFAGNSIISELAIDLNLSPNFLAHFTSACFAPLNNRTEFQNYFCNYVYGKEELFKTGEIKDSQRGIRKRLEAYS